MSENYWMVRKPDFTFVRPILESELIRRIEAGEILPNDEICRGEEYWFTLQDVEEVRKYLGGNIRLQSLVPTGFDLTKTTSPDQLAELRKRKDSRAQPAPRPLPLSTASVAEEMEEPSHRVRTFGIIFAVIFCAVLGMLWIGSR